MFHQQLTNLGAGATLGTGFYRPFRLIDNDGFYVDIYNTPPAVPYAYSSPAPGDAFYNEITWATNMGIYKGTKGGDFRALSGDLTERGCCRPVQILASSMDTGSGL